MARGRGSSSNPKNRFEKVEVAFDEEEAERRRKSGAPTQFLDDASVSILSYNKSPDIPFKVSLNPYRGCEHGCSYCYARPFHEFLGFSAGLDFESRIMVKRQAASLLRKELSKRSWRPQLIAMSGVTDPYQPVERSLRLSRACLEVLAECRNPVSIVTKNRLVTRDLDLLSEMARKELCSVTFSINSLDEELARAMEPRTSSPKGRLEAVRALSAAGVPVGVFVAPVVPGLNDHEVAQVLSAAREAGASFASYIVLRLPRVTQELFFDWLRERFPGKLGRVEHRIREMRGGALNESRFGSRFHAEGVFADSLRQLFQIARRREGLAASGPELSTAHFKRPAAVVGQMNLDL